MNLNYLPNANVKTRDENNCYYYGNGIVRAYSFNKGSSIGETGIYKDNLWCSKSTLYALATNSHVVSGLESGVTVAECITSNNGTLYSNDGLSKALKQQIEECYGKPGC